jgi:hypothetical protein
MSLRIRSRFFNFVPEEPGLCVIAHTCHAMYACLETYMRAEQQRAIRILIKISGREAHDLKS